ncbi:hypothetical protein OUZ56_007162 [Daphnia magna]|uniref:Uncharacterized protein n=1 Tax=Daphnia magna TaxID=35525 RepID=A0ABQ9YXX5_9CRUS|nr:hypothetical protein OUZ56_007162 [Daphnia magna]
MTRGSLIRSTDSGTGLSCINAVGFQRKRCILILNEFLEAALSVLFGHFNSQCPLHSVKGSTLQV